MTAMIPISSYQTTAGGGNFLKFRPGIIRYVNSAGGGSTTSGGRTIESAFTTIQSAIDASSAGDMIVVLEAHAENIADATSFLLATAGVEIVGLGRGTRKPTFTLITAAGATVGVTAASCRLANLNIVSNFTNGVTAGITVGANADGLVLDDITMTETANTKEFLIGISIAAGCSDVSINRLKYCGTAGGSTTSAIFGAGAAHRFSLRDSYINVDASASIVDLLTTASTDIEIYDNRLINVDTGAGLGIGAEATTTGMVARNLITNLKDTVLGVSGAGLSAHENYGSNAVGAQGTVALALAVDT